MSGSLVGQARFLAATLSSIPDFVYAFDRDHRFVYANRAMLSLFGLSEDEFIGKNFAELNYPPDLAQTLDRYIDQVYQTGEPVEDQVFYTSPAGISAYFEFIWGPVFAQDGSVELVVGVSRDQTERQRLEEKLRDGEERQSFLLNLSDALHPLSDYRLIQVTACKMMCERLQIDRALFLDLNARNGAVEIDCAQFALLGRRSVDPGEYARLAKDLIDIGQDAPIIISDLAGDERLTDALKLLLSEINVTALLSVVVVKGGRPMAAMHLHCADRRQWDKAEVELLLDVAERAWAAVRRARAEEAELRKNRVLEGINRIFQEALRPNSDDELGRLCLAVAEDVTGADFSFIGEINHKTGLFDEISVSEAGWRQFSMNDPAFPYGKPPTDLLLHGLYGEVLLSGRPSIFNDPANHPRRVGLPSGHPALEAFMGVPFKKAGKVVGMIGFGRSQGIFRPDDLDAAVALGPVILQAISGNRVAEALKQSEARFRQFSSFTSDVLWIRNGKTLQIEFMNDAFETLYGASKWSVLPPFGVEAWIPLIVSDDRPSVEAALETVKNGEAVTHDFRIVRADGGIRWIRSTDFPLFDEEGGVERIGGISTDITDMKQATEHQAVLLAELQHRTRNIMVMVRSLVNQTGETAQDVGEYTRLIGGRLKALSRTQALLTRAANIGVSLKTLLREELDVAGHRNQYILTGPEVELPPKAAEVLTLAIHELATNALKYGALRHESGRLLVEWRVFSKNDRPWLGLAWTESGLPDPLVPPTREGMGSDLIRGRVPYELRGHGSIAFRPEGVVASIEFPLRKAGSILATDGVPLQVSNLHSGLALHGETPLKDFRVLVVEDDFYTAKDVAQSLKQAGATVVGPASYAGSALSLIDTDRPDAAIIDLNLGKGIDISVASRLGELHVPFIILTGYDDEIIPREYATTLRFQKPVEMLELMRAVAALRRPREPTG